MRSLLLLVLVGEVLEVLLAVLAAFTPLVLFGDAGVVCKTSRSFMIVGHDAVINDLACLQLSPVFVTTVTAYTMMTHRLLAQATCEVMKIAVMVYQTDH